MKTRNRGRDRRMCPALRACIALLAFAFVAIMVRRSSADFYTPWDPQFESQFESQITEDVLQQMCDQLQLSDEQMAAINHLWEAHAAKFVKLKTEGTALRRKLQQDRTKLTPGSPEDIMFLAEREEKLAVYANEQVALDREFFQSVQDMLSEGQAAKWIEFQHRFNRDLVVASPRLF